MNFGKNKKHVMGRKGKLIGNALIQDSKVQYNSR